jgi:hypothetical protein
MSKDREQTAIIKEFETPEEPKWSPSIVNSFKLPERSWNNVIDDYNSANKKKFPFTAEQCKLMIEYVKQGIPPEHIFKSIGVSPVRYHNLVVKASELTDQLDFLSSKEELTDEEYTTFHTLVRNPLRMLISDIARAEGVSELADWELFNSKTPYQPDLLMAKMRAKYRKFFNDKESTGGSVQVQINLGGDFISKM